jgi:hypothetical protein
MCAKIRAILAHRGVTTGRRILHEVLSGPAAETFAMPKPPSRDTKPQIMRSRIAAQAARLIAEDGIDDFALAKRKAARQLGAPTTQSLPNNEEIEAELKAYRQLYQGGEHPVLLQDLRLKALMAMRFFEKFDPYLTGSVLKGSAGRHSAINVQLFAANEKELELFLLNQEIPFDITEEPHFRLGREESVCVLCVEWQGTPLRLALYEPMALRGALKTGAGSAAAERAGIAAVERLINAGAPSATL